MAKNYCEITCVTRKHPSGKSGDRPANQLIGIQPLPKKYSASNESPRITKRPTDFSGGVAP